MFGCVPNLVQTLPEIDLYANNFFRSVRTSVTRIEGKPPRIWYNEVSKARPDGRAFAFKDQGYKSKVRAVCLPKSGLMAFVLKTLLLLDRDRPHRWKQRSVSRRGGASP
jgi:hypothetical protein